MNPIITLTTDFGHKGPFVAVMKGVMLQRAPTARIIDLTHEIHVHWPAEAGFWLVTGLPVSSRQAPCMSRSWTPALEPSETIIAAEYDGHVFLAPDNGLLPLVFEPGVEPKIYRMSDQWHARQDWPKMSSTFHGRDIFAPLAADIAEGRVKPKSIGPPVTDIIPSLLEDPEIENKQVRGSVVAIDHFGNLITNIDQKLDFRFPTPESQGGRTRTRVTSDLWTVSAR